MAGLDLVDWPTGSTLAVSGSAASLRIPLTIRNASAEPLQLVEASLAEVRLAGAGTPLRVEPIPVQMLVAGNGVGRTNLRLRLDPATPPGRYEGEVKLGGLARPVAIQVVPEAKVDVRPGTVVVDAASGREQIVTAAFENRGNVALRIDLAGTYPLAVENPIAAARLEDVEATKPLAAIIDRLAGRESRPALRPFGDIVLDMPRGPIELGPANTVVVEVSLKLPHGLSPTARYHVFAPVYASDLHIIIVTAAKPGLAPASAAKGADA